MAIPVVSDNHSGSRPGLRSFLVSFAGLGFLAFYLAGKLHLFDERGYAVGLVYSFIRFGPC